MARAQSLKHTLIDKSNTQIVIITSIAGFIVVFSLVASFALIKQLSYQNRVIGAKKTALTQLKTDLQATDSLVASYKTFVSGSTNVLGGNPTGVGSQDGSNGKIVLDALPSQYDFPALATSLQKLLSSQNVAISSLSGSDDEVAQSSTAANDNPQPVPIPFQFSVSGNYQNVQNVITALERSIRPIQVQTIAFGGDAQTLTLQVTAQTFYQPAKTFTISTEEVR